MGKKNDSQKSGFRENNTYMALFPLRCKLYIFYHLFSHCPQQVGRRRPCFSQESCQRGWGAGARGLPPGTRRGGQQLHGWSRGLRQRRGLRRPWWHQCLASQPASRPSPVPPPPSPEHVLTATGAHSQSPYLTTSSPHQPLSSR